jgi:hypothetical protein
LLALLFLSSTPPAGSQTSELLFREDFENGWNGWTNDTTYTLDKRFAWVIATPANCPVAPRGGTQCAGTLAEGRDCYLVSPPLLLPATDQYTHHLWLYYWQWQKYSASPTNVCLSDVKIRQHIEGPMGNYWGPWNIIDPGTSGVIPGNSPVWRRRGIDLSLFRGGIVQLGFGHSGNGDPGWLVDDVEVWKVPVLSNWPGTVSFEAGWGDWSSDEGIWDVGKPAVAAITNVPHGLACAGTALDGVPPTVFSGHLWSPMFYLPAVLPGEKAYVEFDQWHDYPSAFGVAVHWAQWWPGIGWTWPQMIDSHLLSVPIQRAWKPVAVDVTRLAGLPLPMRLGFEHSNVYTNTLGWFIDNVRVTVAGFRVLAARREGKDIHLTYTAPANTTNILQCSPALGVSFTNISPPRVSAGSTEVVSTFVHAGAAGSPAPRFYRLRRWP